MRLLDKHLPKAAKTTKVNALEVGNIVVVPDEKNAAIYFSTIKAIQSDEKDGKPAKKYTVIFENNSKTVYNANASILIV